MTGVQTCALPISRKSVLGEVSFVALGADDATSAQIAAQFQANEEQTLMDGTNTVTAQTSTSTTAVAATAPATDAQPPVNPRATAPVTPAIQASAPAATATGPTVDQVRAEAVAESQRIAAIRKLCGAKHAGIEAKAIAEGWDATKTELEVLRASRPKAPQTKIGRASCRGRV